MSVNQVPELSDVEYRKISSKPLLKSTDLPHDLISETLDVITMAVDKFLNTKNYEGAAQLIKNSLDKKFGSCWHCAIGEGFGFEITYQKSNMIYVYYGQLGVLAYKC